MFASLHNLHGSRKLDIKCSNQHDLCVAGYFVNGATKKLHHKNQRSHLCNQPFERKKLSATRKVSLSFNNRHTLGSYRGLNQSEIVKGGPPSLIGRGPDIPVRVCMFDASAAAVRQRERER